MFTLLYLSATSAEKDTTFYANGNIKSCVAQQKSGYKLTKYYESGSVEEVEYFNFNKERVGTWIRYDENGCVISVANFRHDKKDGDWIMYNADGKLVMFIKYKAGKREFVCCLTEDNNLAVAQ